MSMHRCTFGYGENSKNLGAKTWLYKYQLSANTKYIDKNIKKELSKQKI